MDAGKDFIGIATAFCCHDGQGRFVLHQRSARCRDEQRHWEFGAGELDFGEEPEKAVLRELMEEYGCTGEIQEQFPPFSLIRTVDGRTTHWLVIPYVIRVNPEQVRRNEPEYMDAIGWFTLDTLPQPLHSGAQIVLERYRPQLLRYASLPSSSSTPDVHH